MRSPQELGRREQNPHLFRDALATSIAVNDPKNVRIITAVLQHSDQASRKYYNQARAHDASYSLNAAMEALFRRQQRRESS